jgi:phenylalanyl-tRNA synthetase alpha subunit
MSVLIVETLEVFRRDRVTRNHLPQFFRTINPARNHRIQIGWTHGVRG